MDQYLNREEKARYHLFDSVRGICVLGMVIYHTLFDIAVLGGAGYNAAFLTVFDFIRDFGASLFILISGVCFHFGTHRLRRFLVLFIAGIAVSVVSYFALPDAAVVFGILTFMSVSGVLMIPLSRLLQKIHPHVGLFVSLGLFILFFRMNYGNIGTAAHVLIQIPKVFYRNIITAFFGFPYVGFSSGDYYPLFPWFSIYTAGFFLYYPLIDNGKWKRILSIKLPFFSVIGKYSLPIYLAHQPIIFGIVWLIFHFAKT